MTIDHQAMEEKAQEHFKGGEGTVYVTAAGEPTHKIMRVRIPQHASIGMHVHEADFEVFQVMQGTAHVTMNDGTEEVLTAGQAHYCPKGQGHTTRNEDAEDVVLFAVIAAE